MDSSLLTLSAEVSAPWRAPVKLLHNWTIVWLFFVFFFFASHYPFSFLLAVMSLRGRDCSAVLIQWPMVYLEGGDNRMLEKDSEVFKGLVDLVTWDCKLSLHLVPSKHTPDCIYDPNPTFYFSESALLFSCWDLPPFYSHRHIFAHSYSSFSFWVVYRSVKYANKCGLFGTKKHERWRKLEMKQ